MSQYGAYGYALHLKSYDYILGHYYTGTALGDARRQPRRSACCCRAPGSRSPSPAALERRRPASSTRRRPTACAAARGRPRPARRDAARASAPSPGRCASTRPSARRCALNGTSVPGVRDGLLPRLAARSAPSGSRPDRRQRARPRGLRARRRQRREPVGVADRGAARRRPSPRAPTRSRPTPAAARFDQYADTRSQVYRGVAAETPTHRRRRAAPPRGQVVTYGGQPVTTYFFSTSGGETEDVENSFVGSPPKPWLKARRRPVRQPSRPSTAGARSASPPPRSGASCTRCLQGRFKRIKVLQRGVSPRVVRAQVVGTRRRARTSPGRSCARPSGSSTRGPSSRR